MSEIQGDTILIAGFGREGQSTLAYLREHYPRVQVAVADRNADAIKYVHHRTFSGEGYLDEIEEFDTVIKSPGIPPEEIFKKAKHLTTHTNIFFEACPGRIIGVSGTKGKSTTSTLITHVLTEGMKKKIRWKTIMPDIRLIGNVGKPALDYLESSNEDTIFVMELSSYQLMDVRYSPYIAVLLPIYEEHLNYHGSMENYVAAKANITKYQSSDDYFFYYEGNDYCKSIASKSPTTQVSFRKFIGDTPLLGEANQINAGAAVAVATHFAIPGKKILTALGTFKSLPHRLENIGTYKDIEFINDSLATIPEATMHALEALGDKVETLIAGGFDRGINFSKLGPEIATSGVKTLILFPDTGKKIAEALPKKNTIKIFHTDSMKEAVKLAYKNTSEGKICLLSPASTSFNLFKDYEERGNAFRASVQELGK